jgi:hypothetical protein
MKASNAPARLAFGAAAGIAGTLALLGLRTATQRWRPEWMVDELADPGEYLVGRAESALPRAQRRQIPAAVEKAAAGSLHLGYGTTPAALYAALRPDARHPLLEGAALGAALYAAGYLGWLPALGLTPPVTKQRPWQVLTALTQHVLYGVVTVGAFRKLRALAG